MHFFAHDFPGCFKTLVLGSGHWSVAVELWPALRTACDWLQLVPSSAEAGHKPVCPPHLVTTSPAQPSQRRDADLGQSCPVSLLKVQTKFRGTQYAMFKGIN